MSFIARQTAAFLRRAIKPNLPTIVRLARAAQAILVKNYPANPAPFAPMIAGDWTPASKSDDAPRPLLFFLHGGGYMIGAPRFFRFVSRRFARAGFDVFMPAYRLAPEHVFPAALADVLRAYKVIAAQHHGPIIIAGDSAGGGLAISLMIKLRDEGVSLPEAAALFSPWTDLSVSGASVRRHEACDALFTRKTILLGARAILGTARARDPLASPVFGDLHGLPPLLIHVGENEALRDDSERLMRRAQEAGVDAQIKIWPDVPHAWQLMTFIPEALRSRDEAIAFLKEKLARRRV